MPFLIEDVTPRERRVPGGPAADHPNGATGVARLEISTPGPGGARRGLAVLAAAPSPTTLMLGACEVVLVEHGDERRAGPSAVVLSTDAVQSAGELDRRLSHGVRVTLTPEAGG